MEGCPTSTSIQTLFNKTIPAYQDLSSSRNTEAERLLSLVHTEASIVYMQKKP